MAPGQAAVLRDATDRLRRVGVGLVAHANLSASGSLNSWLAAGRRPLVRTSDYAHEMAALRPARSRLLVNEIDQRYELS